MPGLREGISQQCGKKNMQQMDEALDFFGYKRIQNFITNARFSDAPLWDVLARLADKHFGGDESYGIVDDTCYLKSKSSRDSVGVAVRHAGQVGHPANCQSVVTLTLARNAQPVLLKMELYLPKKWTDDPKRMDKVGVPKEHQVHRSKTEIALSQISWALEQGVRFGCLLADSEYMRDRKFRAELEGMGLTCTGGIARDQLVYPADVESILPDQTGRGRKRKHKVPSCRPVKARDYFSADYNGKTVIRKPKGKYSVKSEFRFARIRMAEGKAVSIPGIGQFNAPGETELWLIEEVRHGKDKDGEPCITRKYHVSNRPADTAPEVLVRDVKERWRCETVHQQMKEELGADHFEGRTWKGFHRTLLMVAIAILFLQTVRAENGLFESDGDGTEPMKDNESNAKSSQTESQNSRCRRRRKLTLPQIRKLVAKEIERALRPDIPCPHCQRRIVLSELDNQHPIPAVPGP